MKTPMMIQLKRILLLFASLLLTACNSSQDEVVEAASPQIKTKRLSERDRQMAKFFEAEAAFSFREEDISDPSFYDKPRLQFLWKPHFANPGRQSIWSMKIDGTDLARVVSIEWLYEGDWDVTGFTRPVRSPNNRYIAIMQDKSRDGSKLRLFDLKNRTSEIITELAGDSSFNWSADSQTLYFRKRSWITAYHLPSKQFKKIYKTYAKLDSTRLVFNKTAFAIPYKNKLKLVDLKGNLLQEIEAKSATDSEPYVESMSDDGSVLLVIQWDSQLRKNVYSVRSWTEPEREIYISQVGHRVTYSPYNKEEVFTGHPSIYNFRTKKYTHLDNILPGTKGTDVSLYNQIPYTKETK